VIHVPTIVHGRVLIEPDEDAAIFSGTLIGFHGYAQTAGDMMDELRLIPVAEPWQRISIQALNRFYTRGDAKVVANWMTREDRDLAIADNITYVNNALDLALSTSHSRTPHSAPRTPHCFAGFSQGVAMAYRAALFGGRPAAGIIALAGDIPPELKTGAPTAQPWPKVLIGVGDAEPWYTEDKIQDDLAFLSSAGVDHQLVRFTGAHEWTDAFRASAASFLAGLLSRE
jgi:predicted esterase